LKKYHRRSIRLPEYDYSEEGAYYVTICVQDRLCLLGKIADGKMELSQFGRIIDECWQWLFKRYSYLHCDAYVIMPNHLHAIMMITDQTCRGGSRTAPTECRQDDVDRKRKPLGRLIGAFKTVSTKQINVLRKTPGQVFWQRNYYEHVIRNDKSGGKIRQYIYENPLFWEHDEENPNRTIIKRQPAIDP
jgi:putative transposase